MALRAALTLKVVKCWAVLRAPAGKRLATMLGVLAPLLRRDDELDPGFARGGWAIPTGDQESTAYIASTWQRSDAFLLGRKTYGLFARYWGGQADDSNPFSGEQERV